MPSLAIDRIANREKGISERNYIVTLEPRQCIKGVGNPRLIHSFETSSATLTRNTKNL